LPNLASAPEFLRRDRARWSSCYTAIPTTPTRGSRRSPGWAGDIGALPRISRLRKIARTPRSFTVDRVLQAVQVAEDVTLVVHDGGMVGTAWAAANLERLRGMVITNAVACDGFLVPNCPALGRCVALWANSLLSPHGRARIGQARCSSGRSARSVLNSTRSSSIALPLALRATATPSERR
jgi:pimeloyl-ACP methyl ester carboxylesterase